MPDLHATVQQEAFSVRGALVMPYDELFRLAKAGKPLRTTPGTFGVSAQIARCRINRTGLALVAVRARPRKG